MFEEPCSRGSMVGPQVKIMGVTSGTLELDRRQQNPTGKCPLLNNAVCTHCFLNELCTCSIVKCHQNRLEEPILCGGQSSSGTRTCVAVRQENSSGHPCCDARLCPGSSHSITQIRTREPCRTCKCKHFSGSTCECEKINYSHCAKRSSPISCGVHSTPSFLKDTAVLLLLVLLTYSAPCSATEGAYQFFCSMRNNISRTICLS